MSDTETSILELVSTAYDRARYQALHWEGSFRDYLGICERNPGVARNAWQRMVDMIESHGCEHGGEGAVPRWKIFDDPFSGGRDAVFGLDLALDRLVRTLRAGARGFGPERRVVLLHGPVGSAKSTIARLLKRGLEAYSQEEQGALYTFEWHVDGAQVPSPMHQDPLLLVPHEARAEVERRLNRRHRAEYRLRLEGELDPVSRFLWTELMRRYGGDWNRLIEHVRVKRFTLSEKDRVGIGTFQPKDEKNQDSTELTGDINYRRIAEFGSDADPRAFNFDGEFNIANRGMLEFIEVLKLDVAFLYDLLGATQEHSIKPKKFAQTHIDEVIIGHTNEPEYRKLQSNELMEAFRDRTIKIDVPYNTRVGDEVRIYGRQFAPRELSGRALAPHTLEIAALWAVMTRLEDPTHPNLSLLQKARLYDGREVQGFGPEHVREMQKAAEREGLSGISPRYVQDRIAAALVADKPAVGPLDVLAQLEEGLAHHSLVSNEETRRRYMTLIDTVREEYEEIIKREVQVAISSDRDALDRLCARYIDNIKAYVARHPEWDEALLRRIEEKIDITETRKQDFRQQIMNSLVEVERQGGTFDYAQDKRLGRALELTRFEEQRSTIQLTSDLSRVVDPDIQEKIAVIRSQLMRKFGYDEVSADEVLHLVAGLFARGEAKAEGSGSAEAA
jgi:serine protein kinase